jgi:hypothetical protein
LTVQGRWKGRLPPQSKSLALTLTLSMIARPVLLLNKIVFVTVAADVVTTTGADGDAKSCRASAPLEISCDDSICSDT